MAEDEAAKRREQDPTHDPGTCGRCQYVSDPKCIFYTKEQERMAMIDMRKVLAIAGRVRSREDYVVELGFFTLPKKPDHDMWYLFHCPECLMLTRGKTNGFEPRLQCGDCGFEWSVTQERFYRNAGYRKPTFRKVLGEVLSWKRKYRRPES